LPSALAGLFMRAPASSLRMSCKRMITPDDSQTRLMTNYPFSPWNKLVVCPSLRWSDIISLCVDALCPGCYRRLIIARMAK
jgi:hypothetical protein